MNVLDERNQVTISGEIASEFTDCYKVNSEKFYSFFVNIPRKSGFIDVLPVIVSERIVDVSQNMTGLNVIINGQYRSFNKANGEKIKLVLSVFAKELEFVDEPLTGFDNNTIYLEAVVVKNPIYRKTPYGREIGELLVAVNRSYGKADYIPCICWGRDARFSASFKVGDKLIIRGRIQSREYSKKINEFESEQRIAYEVSVNEVGVARNE